MVVAGAAATPAAIAATPAAIEVSLTIFISEAFLYILSVEMSA